MDIIRIALFLFTSGTTSTVSYVVPYPGKQMTAAARGGHQNGWEPFTSYSLKRSARELILFKMSSEKQLQASSIKTDYEQR